MNCAILQISLILFNFIVCFLKSTVCIIDYELQISSNFFHFNKFSFTNRSLFCNVKFKFQISRKGWTSFPKMQINLTFRFPTFQNWLVESTPVYSATTRQIAKTIWFDISTASTRIKSPHEKKVFKTRNHRCTVIFFWWGTSGVVRKPGRGSSIFVFAFLCYNFSKSFEGVHEVPPSCPPPPPVCIYARNYSFK